MRALTLVAAVGLSVSLQPPAAAQSGQRFADLGTCPTSRGEVVRECRVGYRTFGGLNERRDNAVLVPTWHGGRSETMTFILGWERWIDTTQYFAILVDKLGNGVSTSPSNSRSQPGRRFPGSPTATWSRLSTGWWWSTWASGGCTPSSAGPWAGCRPTSGVSSFPGRGPGGVHRGNAPDGHLRDAIRTMLTSHLGIRSGVSQDTLAVQLADLWHMIATTPAQENTLSRDSVPVMIANEARVDWVSAAPGGQPADAGGGLGVRRAG